MDELVLGRIGDLQQQIAVLTDEVITLHSLLQTLVDRPPDRPTVEGVVDLGWLGQRRVVLTPKQP